VNTVTRWTRIRARVRLDRGAHSDYTSIQPCLSFRVSISLGYDQA